MCNEHSLMSLHICITHNTIITIKIINISITSKSLLGPFSFLFFPEPFKIIQRDQEWSYYLCSHLTISFIYRCYSTLCVYFQYASTPLFLFLVFLKQSTSIWRFIRDSFLPLDDSKPPIYNDKNAEENSSKIKFWVGKIL